MKLSGIMMLVIGLVVSGVPAAWAQTNAAANAPVIVDGGNKLCPVSGERVSGKAFVEYQGKRYGVCCPGCDQEFLNDPEKYLKKMEQQESALREAHKGVPGMSEEI